MILARLGLVCFENVAINIVLLIRIEYVVCNPPIMYVMMNKQETKCRQRFIVFT